MRYLRDSLVRIRAIANRSRAPVHLRRYTGLRLRLLNEFAKALSNVGLDTLSETVKSMQGAILRNMQAWREMAQGAQAREMRRRESMNPTILEGLRAMAQAIGANETQFIESVMQAMPKSESERVYSNGHTISNANAISHVAQGAPLYTFEGEIAKANGWQSREMLACNLDGIAGVRVWQSRNCVLKSTILVSRDMFFEQAKVQHIGYNDKTGVYSMPVSPAMGILEGDMRINFTLETI